MDNIISIEVIECADERLIVSENGAESCQDGHLAVLDDSGPSQ